jgi:hypothetical protein
MTWRLYCLKPLIYYSIGEAKQRRLRLIFGRVASEKSRTVAALSLFYLIEISVNITRPGLDAVFLFYDSTFNRNANITSQV